MYNSHAEVASYLIIFYICPRTTSTLEYTHLNMYELMMYMPIQFAYLFSSILIHK